jgi:UDP-2,3-diacylglucosamine pyrophosphatase LpxH
LAGSNGRCIYIISDLHLGGTYAPTAEGRGFRINTHVSALAGFVSSLALKPPEPRVELVINGDMVDFLAEREREPPFWTPFTIDPDRACAKLQAIADRDGVFFQALGLFLENKHRLVILTGNHDVELVLPSVRRKLREVIGVKPEYDFEFISNGEAYTIGDALIEHGNRYDPWNVVNYDGLRRISSLLSRRQAIPDKYEFDAPAGSKMVSWVINEIKEDYKFIDLLKPETDVAIPLLLALEPGYRLILATVAKLALQARQHLMEEAALPSVGGDISSEIGPGTVDFVSSMSTVTDEAPPAEDEEAALRQVLRERLGDGTRAFLNAVPSKSPLSEPAIGGDISTFSVTKVVDRSLGLAKLLFARDNEDIGSRLPALLQALQALQPERSFDRDFESEQGYSSAANDLFKGGYKYVIFGHTHMAKKIELQPDRWYLNAGTWADLMQLPPEILTARPSEAREKLDPFVQDVAGGVLKPWVVFRPTYIQLDLDENDHVTCAELKDYQEAPVPAS